MLTFTEAGLEFGGDFLFRDVTWVVSPGARIGLVGRNGTGKSTILKIISGELQLSEGSIQRAKGARIGFLNQDLLQVHTAPTAFELALGAYAEAMQAKYELDKAYEAMATDQSPALMKRVDELQARFEQLGGYEMEADTHAVMAGLGFDQTDRYRPLDELSGGWRMRAVLARILLEKPDLLLLDEPTNHLDLPSIQWLEAYLRKANMGYILVSHDRHFLNRMVDQVVEIAHNKLHFYTGDYETYLLQREERRTIQQNAYVNQQKYIEQSERFIQRFRAKATKARQAQSRIKQLEKLERIDAPESDEATMDLKLRQATASGGEVLELQGVGKAFGEKRVLQPSSQLVMRGDKIGLIGPNGIGKSTLLRIIGGLEPHEGKRRLGHKVSQAFFGQHQLEHLHPEQEILDELMAHSHIQDPTYLRTVLGSFLFTEDDVFKPIKVLSGGERARVALAKVLISEANFLLLDEPTNHLDLQSIQVLAQALAQYEGTFIVVSHDRHFLELTTNRIWYIDQRELKDYPGGYQEFAPWWEVNGAQKTAADHQPQPEAKQEKKTDNKALQRKRKALENKIKNHERRIEELEQQLQHISAQMADPELAQDYSKLAALQKESATLRKQQEQTYAEWETDSQALEGLDNA